MASGSFTGSTNNQYITPRILWSSTPNTAANTSNVTVTFQLYKSSSSSSSTYGTGSWTLNINGVAYSFSSQITIPANSTYITVYTKTVNGIAHNTDGTKSISISATGGISGTTYTTTSISGTATFDSIARASGLTVPSSVNTGSDLAVTIAPSNSAFRHKIELVIDGSIKYASGFIAAGTTSLSYSISHAWLPTSTSKPMIVRLNTYTASSGSSIGQVEKIVTVNVPDSIKPTITSFSPTINSGGLSGNYVQGKSSVKLTCAATMNGGATVASYTFSGPNLSASSTSATVTSSTITSSGTLTYKVRVTDSRGRYAESTTTIYVYPYATPKIVSIQAQRCLANGTLDNNGTYAKVTVITSHSAIATSNTATVNLYNSKDNNYGTATRIISSTSASNTYSNVYGSGFLTTTSYTIRATITDIYGASHTLNVTLASAQRAFNVAKYGNGVAIGGFSTVTNATAEGLFECHWRIPSLKIKNDVGNWQIGRTTDNCIVFNNLTTYDVYSPMIRHSYPNGDVGNLGSIQMNATNNTYIGFCGFKSGNTTGNPDSSAFLNITDNTFSVGRLTVASDISFGVENIQQAIHFNDSSSSNWSTSLYKGASNSSVVLSVFDNTNNRHVWYYLNDGNFYINRPTYVTGNIFSTGQMVTNNNQGYRVKRSNGTDINVIRINTTDDLIIGEFAGGANSNTSVYMGGVYNSTSSAYSPNLYMHSNERIYRIASSSQRYKTDIKNIQSEEFMPEKLYDLPVREFKYKEGYLVEDDPLIDNFVPGFIAEEVAEIYPIACEYDGDKPENWNMRFMIPAMLKLIQDQKKEIDTLKEQINNKVVS